MFGLTIAKPIHRVIGIKSVTNKVLLTDPVQRYPTIRRCRGGVANDRISSKQQRMPK